MVKINWEYLINVLFAASWVGLVSKNYEIERACAELEAEVERLRQQQQQEQQQERWWDELHWILFVYPWVELIM